MLALIKREIIDSAVFFLITAIFVFALSSSLAYRVAMGFENNQAFGVPSLMYEFFFVFIYLALFPTAFGAVQMNLDKNKNTSSFLATLATTRRRILLAKIITGLLWILLVFVPFAVTDAVLLKVFPRAALPDAGFLIRIFVTFFICALACYSFGLFIGCRAGKLIPALGVIMVTPILVSLIAIKGFSAQTMIIFILFTVAATIRAWQKFMSSSL